MRLWCVHSVMFVWFLYIDVGFIFHFIFKINNVNSFISLFRVSQNTNSESDINHMFFTGKTNVYVCVLCVCCVCALYVCGVRAV